MLDAVDCVVAIFVIVLWLDVVDIVLTIPDVVLLVLELDAVDFDTVLNVQGIVEVVLCILL